jgi:hypothetical protein
MAIIYLRIPQNYSLMGILHILHTWMEFLGIIMHVQMHYIDIIIPRYYKPATAMLPAQPSLPIIGGDDDNRLQTGLTSPEPALHGMDHGGGTTMHELVFVEGILLTLCHVH